METVDEFSTYLVGATEFSISFWVKHPFNISTIEPEIYFSLGGNNDATSASTLTFGKIS